MEKEAGGVERMGEASPGWFLRACWEPGGAGASFHIFFLVSSLHYSFRVSEDMLNVRQLTSQEALSTLGLRV